MKKSNQRIVEERVLTEFGLLIENQLYNPSTNRYLRATGANVRMVYNLLISEIARPPSLVLQQEQEEEKEREEKVEEKEEEEKEYHKVRDQIDFDELIKSGKRYVIKLRLRGGVSEAFMLNRDTVEQIKKLLNDGYRENVKDEYGSDSIFRANYIGIISFTIEEIIPTHRINDRDGSFFNYLNNTKLDLTRYQILNTPDKTKITKEQCVNRVLRGYKIKKIKTTDIEDIEETKTTDIEETKPTNIEETKTIDTRIYEDVDECGPTTHLHPKNEEANIILNKIFNSNAKWFVEWACDRHGVEIRYNCKTCFNDPTQIDNKLYNSYILLTAGSCTTGCSWWEHRKKRKVIEESPLIEELRQLVYSTIYHKKEVKKETKIIEKTIEINDILNKMLKNDAKWFVVKKSQDEVIILNNFFNRLILDRYEFNDICHLYSSSNKESRLLNKKYPQLNELRKLLFTEEWIKEGINEEELSELSASVKLEDIEETSNTISKKILKEQCLLFSLKQQGVSKAEINAVKLMISNKSIPKKDLERICDTIHKKIILHSYKTDNLKTTQQIYGKKYEEVINVAIYKNHYFTYETTQYNKYFINNYEKLKDIAGAKNYYKMSNGKYRTSKGNEHRCDSLYLIHHLFNSGFFLSDTYLLSTVDDNSGYEHDEIPLSMIKEEQHLFEKREPNNKNYQLFFGDTETIVSEGEHQLYKLGVIGTDDTIPEIYNADENWVNKLFDYVKKRTPHGKIAVLYFHNLKYDFVASLKKHITCIKPLIKDNTLYRVSIKHFGFTIELRDSYKLISAPLRDFPKIFDLSKGLEKKEAINYNFYNLETLKTEKHSVKDYIKNFEVEEKNIFFEAMKLDFDFNGDTFNANKYYDYYLYFDVVILKEGLLKLSEALYDISAGIDEYGDNIREPLEMKDYLTISSFAHAYMVENGAYEGVYEVKGNLREFISKAVYGGRVNVNESIKGKVLEPEGGISDFDGVSLYPSAMSRLCEEIGVPKGEAKRIENKNYLTMDYYVVKIQITKINKQQKNPFIAIRTKNGIDYVNSISKPTVVYVDKITLEDYIKFHEIEYEFLDGVYWNQGYNKLLGRLVKELFEERKKYKKAKKDVLQNMVKLIMNSIYGKTITSKSKNKIIYLAKNKYNKKTGITTVNNENLNNYIYNNFNKIVKYKDINDKQVEITENKADDTFNLGHVGTVILSYSKRIMNEVMSTASDNNINIYYQDTDSMHMNYTDIQNLSKIYKVEYNKELIGNDLCQFHTDFNLKGATGEITSKKSIFLGKKSYIDLLESKDKDGNTINGCHYRMKGVTVNAIKNEVEKTCGGDFFKLYEKLANKEEIDFILNPYEKKVMFEYTKSGVRTRKTGEFIRKLKF